MTDINRLIGKLNEWAGDLDDQLTRDAADALAAQQAEIERLDGERRKWLANSEEQHRRLAEAVEVIHCCMDEDAAVWSPLARAFLAAQEAGR